MSKDNQGDLLNQEETEALINAVSGNEETVVQEVEGETIIQNAEQINSHMVPIQPESKEIAVQSEIGNLLQLAVSNGADMDVLERLIKMKNAEEDRNCKKEFDFHFSEMQKDYIPAEKKGSVLNTEGNKVLYKFCTLEEITGVYAPIITKHGFSYRWVEEMKTDSLKLISCIISGYGHQEVSVVEIPINPGNAFTNSIQQRGVSTSYGKRYSFINGFGVIIADEDTDAVNVTFEDGIKYSKQIEWIRSCKIGEDLKKTMKEIWEQFPNDKEAKEIFTIEYNKKKAEFMGNNK